MPSKCWSCTREENGEIINTLCNGENMKVVDCATGSVGCVESLMTFGTTEHDLRHCLEPTKENSSNVTPRDLVPIDAYDDEIYAKGCLKVYGVQRNMFIGSLDNGSIRCLLVKFFNSSI